MVFSTLVYFHRGEAIRIIGDKVFDIMKEALGLEDEEVTKDSNIIDDLAAESIDFVDITYYLEKEFGFKINPGDMFPSFLREVEIFDSNNILNKSVRDRFENDYPFIKESLIKTFEQNQNPNVFLL